MKKIIAIVGFLGVFASQALVSSAAYFNSAPIVRCETQITQTLQKGSENNDVFILQKMLGNAGFLHAAPNGYFGYQTTQAVREFQRANYLPVTGTVGEATRNAINERMCDTDLLDNSYSYDVYGYNNGNSGVTYVNQVDPYVTVKVVTPESTTPVVYATPQSRTSVSSIATTHSVTTAAPFAVVAPTVTSTLSPTLTPAYVSSQVAGSGIVYNPSTGYSIGITPRSGSVTVGSPVANAVYNEGDTVFVNWTTDNLTTSSFAIVIESSITGQKTTVAVVPGNSYSFVLTKELLDSVCAGTCNNNQFGSFKISVNTPTIDIAGNQTLLRAAVTPITIRRPYAQGKLTITVSKSPVSSGELFKLYVNAPINSYENYKNGTYSLKIKSTCPSSVTVSLAGASCGQEIVVPFELSRLEQGIPVTITNPTWYAQNVTFQVALVSTQGQIVADTDAKVTVNAAPFSW